MTDSLMETKDVKDLLMKVSNLGEGGGDVRMKRIVHRVVSDLFRTIEDFDVQPALTQVLTIDISHFEFTPRGGLQPVSNVDHIIVIEVEPGNCELTPRDFRFLLE